MVIAHVLSARCAQYTSQGDASVWIFGVLLEREVEGSQRWIIETADPAVIAQLHSAYTEKSPTSIYSSLFVDPAINAVD